MTVTPQTAALLEQAGLAIQERDWFALTQHFQQLSQCLPDTLTLEDWNAEPELHGLWTLALDLLELGDFYDRWEFAKLLPLLGETVVPSLIAILQDETAAWETRWFIARILAGFQTPVVLKTLLQLLTHPPSSADQDLQTIAIEAFAHMGEAALVALTPLLTDEQLCLVAVRVLAQVQSSSIVEPLLQVANAPNSEVRVLAITALGRFSDPRILPILQNALQDPIASVRREAVIALGLRSAWEESEAVGSIVQQLGDCLQDPDGAVSQQAALALSRSKQQAAASILFQALNHPETPIPLQIEVVRALGWLGMPLALEYLHQRLVNRSDLPASVEQEIITVLGRITELDLQPQAAGILLELLQSTSENGLNRAVRQAIIMGLGHLGDRRAIAELITLLADPDPGLQLHTIASLQQIDATLAYQQLETLASSQTISASLHQGITRALREWSRASASSG